MPLFKKRKEEPAVPVTDNQMWEVLELLKRNWVRLGHDAWYGYKTKGRGLLLLDFAADTASYVPLAGTARGSQAEDYCRVYDPRFEMVILLHGFFGGDSVLCIKPRTPPDRPTPPESFIEFEEADLREEAEWMWR
jgi:hypothetical protein